MTETVRCDSCGRRGPGGRDSPPDGWAALAVIDLVQGSGDDDGAVTLVACSWTCTVERFAVHCQMIKAVYEVLAGPDESWPATGADESG